MNQNRSDQQLDAELRVLAVLLEFLFAAASCIRQIR